MEVLLGAGGRMGEEQVGGEWYYTGGRVQRRHIQQVLLSPPAIYSGVEIPEVQVSTCS